MREGCCRSVRLRGRRYMLGQVDGLSSSHMECWCVDIECCRNVGSRVCRRHDKTPANVVASSAVTCQVRSTWDGCVIRRGDLAPETWRRPPTSSRRLDSAIEHRFHLLSSCLSDDEARLQLHPARAVLATRQCERACLHLRSRSNTGAEIIKNAITHCSAVSAGTARRSGRVPFDRSAKRGSH